MNMKMTTTVADVGQADVLASEDVAEIHLP
jgi:hypothetical protein